MGRKNNKHSRRDIKKHNHKQHKKPQQKTQEKEIIIFGNKIIERYIPINDLVDIVLSYTERCVGYIKYGSFKTCWNSIFNCKCMYCKCGIRKQSVYNLICNYCYSCDGCGLKRRYTFANFDSGSCISCISHRRGRKNKITIRYRCGTTIVDIDGNTSICNEVVFKECEKCDIHSR